MHGKLFSANRCTNIDSTSSLMLLQGARRAHRYDVTGGRGNKLVTSIAAMVAWSFEVGGAREPCRQAQPLSYAADEEQDHSCILKQYTNGNAKPSDPNIWTVHDNKILQLTALPNNPIQKLIPIYNSLKSNYLFAK
jgi:hypothetical protein